MPKFEKFLSIDAELEDKQSNLMAISQSSSETIVFEYLTVSHQIRGFKVSLQANIEAGNGSALA